MMKSDFRGSAKIIQFPVRDRATADGQREKSKPAGDLGSPEVSGGASGSGWYHEVAIEESRRASER
jgi:Protein of unknown function (DUF2735)